jgi:hypothetical protein
MLHIPQKKGIYGVTIMVGKEGKWNKEKRGGAACHSDQQRKAENGGIRQTAIAT